MTEHLERARHDRAGLRSLIGRVERALASPGGGRADAWTKELGVELEDLADAIETHIWVSEESGGILDEIVAHEPRLAHRVDRARQDHVELRRRCELARAALAHGVDEARDRTVELLMAIVRHRHLGADLVYDAFNVDLEAAD